MVNDANIAFQLITMSDYTILSILRSNARELALIQFAPSNNMLKRKREQTCWVPLNFIEGIKYDEYLKDLENSATNVRRLLLR